MKKSLILFLFFFFAAAAAAEKITLDMCQEAALSSKRIKVFEYEMSAAGAAVKAAKTFYFPSVFLEGSFVYLQNIPKLELSTPFGNMEKEMGDNINYSAGIALYWTLFDGNARVKNYKAALALFEAKKAQLEFEKRKVLFELRSAYFKLINALAYLELFNEQMQLSVSQNADIKKSVSAGIRSALDAALSDAEVLRRKRQISAGQIVVIEIVQEINALTDGLISIAEGDGGRHKISNDLADFDQSSDLFERFIKNTNLNFDEKNPSVLSIELLSQHYEFLSKAQGSLNYPQINVFAKSSLDYPNGPVLESVQQNKAGAEFSMPVYQARGNRNLKNQNRDLSASNKEKAEQVLADLRRQFHYLKQNISLLIDQMQLNKEIVAKNKSASEIVRKSYQAGNAKFLDVLDMDLRVLQAQADEVNAYTQVLICLALLEGIGK